MDENNEKTLLVHACSTLICDLSHIIWFREFSNDLKKREKEKVTLSAHEEFSLTFYKCFQKHIKNLQKYSKMITKFRESGLFIDELEDSVNDNDLSFSRDFFQKILQEIIILQKCKLYSTKMSSIMHRVMSNNIDGIQPIRATMMHSFKTEFYTFPKDEEVEIIEMMSDSFWKVKIRDRVLMMPSMFLKLHADNAEIQIIVKLLERLKNLVVVICEKYLDFISDSSTTNVSDVIIRSIESNISEKVNNFLKLAAKENVIISEDQMKNLALLKKASIYLGASSLNEVREFGKAKSNLSKLKNENFNMSLKFEIEVSDTNISNEERIEKVFSERNI